MNAAALDRDIATLNQNKDRWARLPVTRKIGYLQQVIAGILEQAERQVSAALRAKGLSPASPVAGEEWLGGPVVTMRTLRLTLQSLRQIAREGRPRLRPGSVRQRPDGQVVVEVFPETQLDRLMWKDFRAEVWIDPSVTPQELPGTMARFYQQAVPAGKVALVLGAGNVASIGPLDLAYKLWVEGQVCLFKHNPVNDYLGPFVEAAFAPLIRDGFVRTAYGGPDVGEHLCSHPGIDEIHITGSDRTHDAIVFGMGEEGTCAKQEGRPRLDKRITSELGNVSPVIVVPGPWSAADLRFQAENIATQMANNAGFNCNAAKLLVLQQGWRLRNDLMYELRGALAQIPRRPAYYPGAEERYDKFIASHPTAQQIGERGEGVLPWALIPGLDHEKRDELCFTTESFCGVTGETALPAADAAEFLERAVEFVNTRVWGTLNCCLLVHPETARQLGERLERAVAELRYGSIGVNHWPAMSYALGSTTWGAFPGHTYNDIQSGIGVVHNTLMFDRPQKSVVWGPFRVWPRPAWFVTNKKTHLVAPKLLELEARPSLVRLPGIVLAALGG